MAYSAETIARWFTNWASANDADLSNLKLQKLLYYAQGFHLARMEQPLFDDSIEAWAYGPVVPSVYRAFKEFGSGDIPVHPNEPFEWGDVDPDTTEFLIDIWNAYGHLAAWKLRDMTHGEAPWKDHFEPEVRNIEIPLDAMRRFFLVPVANAAAG